jgi:hypothetical protein
LPRFNFAEWSSGCKTDNMKNSTVARYQILLAELRAVELWDTDYYRKKSHSHQDRQAYENRRARRAEILSELIRLNRLKP